MINKEYIASELYRGYCESVGGESFNGEPLPDWEAFYADGVKEIQAFAWVSAAEGATQLPASEFDSTFAGSPNYLKAGLPLQRSGWDGLGGFVYMVPANSYPAQTGVAKTHFGEGALGPYGAYFAIKDVGGTVNTWVPSISDIMATDWVLAPLGSIGG